MARRRETNSDERRQILTALETADPRAWYGRLKSQTSRSPTEYLFLAFLSDFCENNPLALPRWLLVAGRLAAVLGVLAIQTAVLVAIALALGWAPASGGLGWALLLIALGAAAFGSLGILLGGLFMPREDMPEALYAISNVLPLSYAIDAINAVTAGDEGWDVYGPLLVVAAFLVGSLILASLTLRRRTP